MTWSAPKTTPYFSACLLASRCVSRGFGIADDALWVSNTQLGCQVGNDPDGDIHGISEKGSQEPECSDLKGKPKSIMIATALGNKQTIFVIQVKIAGKLLRRRFADVPPIALFLFLGQVIYGHAAFLVFLSIKQSFSFKRTRNNRKAEHAWTIG
jgi:hypothetical protein